MTALDRVVDALERHGSRVTGAGNRRQCQCPAHEDRAPSLSVTGIEGRALVYDHGGCDTRDVLAALGLTTADLFDDPRGQKYAYHDGRIVYRSPDKKFRQAGHTNGTAQLFRLPKVTEAIKAGTSVYVCYADDTEVLTPTGWVALPALPDGAEVAQYWLDGSVTFVKPSARQVFPYAGPMVSIEADWSALLVTPDHRVLCRWRKTDATTIRAEDVGVQRYLPVAGLLEGNTSRGPHTDEARLIAAWQADGVNTTRGYRVGWNVKKARKVERIHELLDACGIAWKDQQFPAATGWTYVSVDRRDTHLLTTENKTFGWSLLNWPLASRQALLHELGYWDGDHPGVEGVRYFTADEQSAQVISAIAATSGWGSITRRDDRPERPEQGPQWVVSLVPRPWRTLGNAPTTRKYEGGHVYCLTVPSSYLVTRRNGKVTIAGNCEGEQDVLALEELGAVATTAPMGASNWGKVDPSPLKGAHVIVVPDRDAAGERWLKDVTKSLKPLARSIRVARAKTGNDAADHLAAGHELDDLDEDYDAYTEAPRPTWEPLDLTAILDGTYVPVEPALLPRGDGQCLLYPARVHDIHGESESGKSMVIQAEAARLLALGRGVVIIDYESTASTVVGRLLLMGVEAAAIGARLAYIRPQRSPVDPAEIDAWHQLLARRDVDLVILDGVTEALATMAKSTKDNDEITAWMRHVPHNLAEQTGAAVVLIDHVTKSAEGRGRFAIGAQAKMMSIDGASYAVEVVEPLGRGMRGVLRLWVGKDREGAIRPKCGRFNPEDRTQVAATIVVDSRNGPITVDVQAPDDLIGTERKPFRPTHLMELTSRALEGRTEPLTGNDIVKSTLYVAGKREAKVVALRVLVEEGFVSTELAPRNSVHHKSMRPYREADDPAVQDRGPSEGSAGGAASLLSTGAPEDGARAPILPPGPSQRNSATGPGPSRAPVGPSQSVPSPTCLSCGWALDSYGHETACKPPEDTA